jgi:oxalate decarboxylase/phosphoglucose isomerase-like protein (cupin superfamily)
VGVSPRWDDGRRSGTQTVGDEEFPVAEGDMVYIPMTTLHSTMNAGWRTLRLIVTYTPGGEEQALTALPDFTRHPAGDIVQWERSARRKVLLTREVRPRSTRSWDSPRRSVRIRR